MIDPVTLLVDAEDAVAEAIAVAVEVTGAECETVAAPAYEDPWHVKNIFMNQMAMDGAEEAIGNVKRLLALAEAAATECTEPKERAEKLVDVADRWKYLLSL